MRLVFKPPIQPLLPSFHTRLRRLWRRFRTDGLWSTLDWVWRQSVPRITGIPVLADGRIAPLVWVGPQHGRLGLWRLRLAGIRRTVSLRAEFDDAEHHLTSKAYCYLPTEDHEAPSLEQLLEGVAFVQRAVEQGEKVYIHCKHGRGRAPTLGAAFLIRGGLTAAQAELFVRRARPCVGLSAAQRAQLEAFARYGRATWGKSNRRSPHRD